MGVLAVSLLQACHPSMHRENRGWEPGVSRGRPPARGAQPSRSLCSGGQQLPSGHRGQHRDGVVAGHRTRAAGPTAASWEDRPGQWTESGGCVTREAGPGSGSSRWWLQGPLQPGSEDVSRRRVLEVAPHDRSGWSLSAVTPLPDASLLFSLLFLGQSNGIIRSC